MTDSTKPQKVKFREDVVRHLLETGSRYGASADALQSWADLPENRQHIELFHGGERPARTIAALLFHDFLAELTDRRRPPE
jgi:hypothetical protein